MTAGKRHVQQIVPADGWWAYSVRERDVVELERLTVFALVQYEDGALRICGLDDKLDPDYAPETSGCDEYVFVGPNATEADARRVAMERERRLA